MSIFVLGDPHLSTGVEKPMDVFGGWEHYTEQIVDHWNRLIAKEDTVVLPGDISWGMSLAEALTDFQLLDGLPGKKILLKGNHDYWWDTVTKMERFFVENGIASIRFLHNNWYAVEGAVLCGTRGWVNDMKDEHNRKIVLREAERLRLSLRSAGETPGERIVFLHYPPIYYGAQCDEIVAVLKEFSVSRCFYGHIHGDMRRFAFEGERDGIRYRLVSADALGFCPLKIL